MKKITLLAVLAAILFGILLYGYLDSLEKKVTETEAESVVLPETVPVVVAAADIPPFTDITDEMLTMKEFPVNVVPETAARSFEQVVGLQSGGIVVKDTMLFPSAVGTAEEVGASLSYTIPKGMRAMTVIIDYDTGVGGYLTEGDRVDLLQFMNTSGSIREKEENPDGEETTEKTLDFLITGNGEKREVTSSAVCILLENIEILKIGEKGFNPDTDGMYSTVTLALTPEQTLDLMNAQNRDDCSFGIALRSRGDEEIRNLPILSYTGSMERFPVEETP